MKKNQTKYKIKKDRYYKSRGGTSQILQIDCSGCGSNIAYYQKDGPGSLLRMYLDRIHDCASTRDLSGVRQKSELPSIKCPVCDKLIGIPMVYEPEQRLAFRIVDGSIKKTKLK